MAKLPKIKMGFKKIKIMRKEKASSRAKNTLREINQKEILRKASKEPLGAEELVVEKTKFATHQDVVRAAPALQKELPAGYGQDRIVLATRDPWWIHAYWEVTSEALERLKDRLEKAYFSAKMILRVYDVSFIVFDGTNAHSFFDIEISNRISNWYIDTGSPGRSWCVDIGLRLATGEFIKIARSNTVFTPLAGPSWITDEEWMIPDDMFGRLYGMGFGFGRSSPVGKVWQERMKALFSGILSSPGLASPIKKIPKEKKFWLTVNTELIVYGATEANAKVSIQGKTIKLRPDGTFSLRFLLPNGKQVIPVEAVSSDGLEKRTITPIVSKETK